MPSIKKIETTVRNVKITTSDNGSASLAVTADDGLVSSVVVDEATMIEAVLEYAHERRIRRTRKIEAAKVRKPGKPRIRREKTNEMIEEHPGTQDEALAEQEDFLRQRRVPA